MKTVLRRFVLAMPTVAVLSGCATLPQPPKEDRFEYGIDPAVTPTQAELPGLDGGPPRKVGVVVGPDGRRDEFVANEVVFRPKSEEDLNAFLARYGGTVLRDGKPVLLPEVAAKSPPPTSSGWYLIRVDPAHSSLDDLAANMERGGSRGRHLFSSEEAARLGALLGREKLSEKRTVGPNFLVSPAAVEEHPDGSGGFLDASSWWWMTDDADPAAPGDQGLSIGVIRAWRYLGYKKVPPIGIWSPPIIAIVDAGFDLDGSGNPVSAAGDFFPSRPINFDIVDHDFNAGGTNPASCSGSPCPWHGQDVYGVAAAPHSNRFGGAGTGGHVAWPMLIRTEATAYSLSQGIRSATINGASVINVSVGGGCTVWDWICALPPDDIYAMFEDAVLLARSWGAVVVAAAGNQGIDLGTDDEIPCETAGVICVGAIDQNANNAFNWGSSVDIWAPTNIFSTVTPPRAGLSGASAICCFGGTSAAAPFVSGVVALMKALNPNIHSTQVQTILQETANASPDPKVARGYVDAFRAVERVAPNQPPVIEVNIPQDGWTLSHNHNVYLHAKVTDPEAGTEFSGTVVFTSDRDGELCRTSGFVTGCQGPILSLGPHVITAVATDSFDGTASASISINVLNQVPVAYITFPEEGATYFADQTINLRGYGFDWDELIPQSSMVWTSSIGGAIGTGQDILVSLAPGAHTITLTATDSLGLFGQDTLALNVQPASGHPTALITSPENNGFFGPGTSLTFQAQATDPEDGALDGASVSWFSDVDGLLGNGATLTRVLSGPPVPCNPESVQHKITVRVRDSDGHEATHSIVLNVGQIC
jgi:Subtilase family